MKILRPEYMKNFKCIGSSCVDNCCIGWDVDIDQTTYLKYMDVKTMPLVKMFDELLVINPDCYSVDINYAKVKLTREKYCPFLDQEHLCVIQKNIGEQFLSNVCNQFPRIMNKVDGQCEVSASVACPEATRLILNLPDGLVFETIEESSERIPMISFDVNTKDKLYQNTPVQHLHKIRWLCIEIMQVRTLTIMERMLWVGEVIEALTKAKNSEAVMNILKTHRKKAKCTIQTQENEGVNTSAFFIDEKKHQIANTLLQLLDYKKTIDSKRYIHLVKQSEKALTGLKIQEIEVLKMQYFNPFFERYPHYFENYFVNHMFKGLFPFTEAEWIFDAYLLMLNRFVMMHHQLVGLAIAQKGLAESVVLDYFQAYSKAIEHHKTYLLDVTDWMHDQNIHTMKQVYKNYNA